jgi:7-carboxy-7-deazaguanine synthase
MPRSEDKKPSARGLQLASAPIRRSAFRAPRSTAPRQLQSPLRYTTDLPIYASRRKAASNMTLVVNEIYLSLQGESTFAGLPCIFLRLTACNLRCSYCDTAYAFTEGKKMALPEIRARIDELAQPFRRQAPTLSSPTEAPATLAGWERSLPLIELTGGEPLLQPNSVPLMKQLCDAGFLVLLETSGAWDISAVDPRVHRIVDLKCPSSGESDRNLWDNLNHLRSTDELKFVIGTAQDYDWAKHQLHEHGLARRCPVLFSWVAPLAPGQQDKSLKPVPAGHAPITRLELVEFIIRDALPVRFQLQMHKIVWAPDQRGV